MPALAYATILFARLYEQLVPVRYRSIVFKIIVTAIILVYIHYSPWIYAFALTPEGMHRRRWLPRWD